MKLEIDRTTITDALSKLAPIAVGNKVMPVLSNVRIKCTRDLLRLEATDLEIGLAIEIANHRCAEDGEILVDGKRLYDTCKAMTGDMMAFSSDHGNYRLTLESGASSFVLLGSDPADFPVWPTDSPMFAMDMAAGILCGAIDSISFAASRDESRFNLNGVLWEVRNSKLRLVATDGHRLAFGDDIADVISEDRMLIVPRKGMDFIRKFIGKSAGSVTVDVSPKYIAIALPGGELRCRLIDGEYPNYEKVIPQDSPTSVLHCSKDSLRKSCELARLMTSDRNRGVNVDADQASLRVSMTNPDIGSAEDVIDADCNGNPFGFIANVEYLLDALGALATGDITLSYYKEGSPVIFRCANVKENYLNLVMPMRK